MKTLILALIGTLLSITSPAASVQDIPTGAQGVVYINSVKFGNLPFLHGIKGNGLYLTTNNKGAACIIEPVVLVAGGFNSNQFSFGQGQPIVLTIYSEEVSDRLKQGKKTASIDYDVSGPMENNHQDISIVSGLTLEEGFILHPRKAWSSWFGFKPTSLACQPIASET